MTKSVKVRLTFQAGKSVNFKFGENNIAISSAGSVIDQRFADLIMAQLPGWIELVPKKSTRKAKTAKES